MSNLKALLVILPVIVMMFVVAKPICLRFMAAEDFARRRNVWLALTVVAFVSPSFWLFVLVAMPLLFWATQRDPNPTALYLLLLLALPPIGFQIPTVLINQLFELNYYRILSIAILIPAAWRLLGERKVAHDNPYRTTDRLLVAFAVLHLLLLMPYESITNTMRRATIFVMDAGVLYYVASRTCSTRRNLLETMACFCLACAVIVPLAVFEYLKDWLLYTGLGSEWGQVIDFAYLYRSGSLRAQASAGHSIALGWVLAIGFGFWLYLRTQVKSSTGIVVAVWLWVGLIAAYSRGPWLTAAVIFFMHLALSPKGLGRFVLALVVASILGAVVLASPIGDRVIDSLPFIGTVDEANVTYRQRLAALAWELIKMNPVLGSPFVLLYLESLRQGQGIIDLVNTYATIGMYYGIPALCLFVGFSLAGLWNAYKLMRRSKLTDPDLALLGAVLIACIVGMLLFMATGSFGTSLVVMYFTMPGLAAGFAQLDRAAQPVPAQGSARLNSGLGHPVGARRP